MPSPERPELVADEVRRRHENDRDRLRNDLPQPELDQHGEDGEVADVDDQRHREEAQALVREVAAIAAERPEPVPEVVVRDGDEERAGRRQPVVQVRAVEQRDVDDEG